MGKIAFWWCGKCGFKNHPRLPKAGNPDQPVDDQFCEQCGTKVDDVTTPGLPFTPA